jgi:hypothetical protein
MAGKLMYDRFVEMEQTTAALINRVLNLEQQVANQAVAMKALTDLAAKATLHDPTILKGQAAQAQAMGRVGEVYNANNLYAPLRSDTKPLLEMSAFVRKVAGFDFRDLDDRQGWRSLVDLVVEANDLVKRHT